MAPLRDHLRPPEFMAAVALAGPPGRGGRGQRRPLLRASAEYCHASWAASGWSTRPWRM